MVETNDIKKEDDQNIYVSIDHLKSGQYVFNITLDNKVVKSFRLKK
ncbi:hypothetical protein [Pseudalgibacter alginicilyticus]|nr:hypothetical protein [Pseudalgibacter alginicilyticus]